MNEIIKVSYESENPTVSARELHEFLEVKEKYTQWFGRMKDYGFIENIDYLLLSEKKETNNPKNPTTIITEHQLTVDMAKEISMLQRTEKGKQVRQYFIEIEKEWNSPEKIMSRALVLAHKSINSLTVSNLQLTQRIAEYEPKIEYLDKILKSTGTLATTQIAADYGISAKRLNRILHEQHIQHFVGNQWILYTEHMNLGYTKSETIDIVRSNGKPDTRMFTKWTQKGRIMINTLLNKQDIYAID